MKEYHDNVAWCHSGRNRLKQGGYCSRNEAGWGGILGLCNEFMENRMIPLEENHTFMLSSVASMMEIFHHYIC